MLYIIKITICVVLISLLSIPVFADGKVAAKKQPSVVTKVTGTVYDTGVGIAERTEGLLSGCLRTTFSFFNPCLDLVKNCATVAMSPIEKPLDWAENAMARRTQTKNVASMRAPQPKKPELLKK